MAFQSLSRRISNKNMTIDESKLPAPHRNILLCEPGSKYIHRMTFYSFQNALENHSDLYKKIVEESIYLDPNFAKYCMTINPNIYDYLHPVLQEDKEIIDFVNSLSLVDYKYINFIYRHQNREKYAERFAEYLERYKQESNDFYTLSREEIAEKYGVYPKDELVNR